MIYLRVEFFWFEFEFERVGSVGLVFAESAEFAAAFAFVLFLEEATEAEVLEVESVEGFAACYFLGQIKNPPKLLNLSGLTIFV